jgi:hypothetical protein
MASTYSPNLRVELIGTGDQAGTWGTTTNNNLGTLLENAISGYEAVSVTAANQALTALNGIDDQARNLMLNFSTTTGADFAVYAPPSPKVYVVKNSSAYTVSVYNSSVLGNTTAAGTGVAIPSGKTISIWSDGTNMAAQITHLPALTLTSDLAIADGGTGASTAAGARTNLDVTATGADTTYAFRANNLSDLASASSARTNLGLGTIATQNSNAVSITGGSVSGITDIAIADGGTGASDAATARSNLGVTATGSDTTYAFRANNLSDLSNISTARSNLGLGTLATLSSINDGNWSGTDLSVANGGTGASDAATARTNLSVPSTLQALGHLVLGLYLLVGTQPRLRVRQALRATQQVPPTLLTPPTLLILRVHPHQMCLQQRLPLVLPALLHTYVAIELGPLYHKLTTLSKFIAAY